MIASVGNIGFCRVADFWTYLAGTVRQLSKQNLGVYSVLYEGTDAAYFDPAGRHLAEDRWTNPEPVAQRRHAETGEQLFP